MSLNSENILSTQTHPGDSVVTTITGAQHKGDGFYGRSDGLHTIQVTVTGFIGKVAMQGGVKNYLGKKKTVTVPKDWQSSPDHPTTELAYITKAEKDLLIKNHIEQ